MSYSYATNRKIRIIREQLGADWAPEDQTQSIDAIYNNLVGDTRKNLFCKIESNVKDRLDSMTEFYHTGMAEFIQQLIDTEWVKHQKRQEDSRNALVAEFSG